MHEDDTDAAKSELKRIDHLVFVTLKYTRTVDVIRTIMSKFIAAIDFKVEDYFNHLLENEKISKIPKVPLVRVRKMEVMYKKDKTVKDIVDFYVLLKKIYNAEYRPREEYRKNVTLVTKVKEVNIPILKEYAKLVIEYVDYIDGLKK
tara:strand:- start:9307 stop:9747 length:441 start_codon:yes stop_codon:yes gene_type:complete